MSNGNFRFKLSANLFYTNLKKIKEKKKKLTEHYTHTHTLQVAYRQKLPIGLNFWAATGIDHLRLMEQKIFYLVTCSDLWTQ